MNFVTKNLGMDFYEDDNIRICLGLEECGYVVAIYNKNTKVLIQRIYDPNTFELIDEQIFDLNTPIDLSIMNGSAYTLGGWGYWQGMNDGVETFIATRRGGDTKAV